MRDIAIKALEEMGHTPGYLRGAAALLGIASDSDELIPLPFAI